MKLNRILQASVVSLLGLWVAAGTASADPYPCYLAPNFVGSYAMQLTGSLFLPAPFDSANGPFFRNFRFTADGKGNIQTGTVVANYGGTIYRESYAATYVVRPDGTFTITINNLPVPAFPPSIPNVFTLEGVFFNCASSAKVVVAGVSLGGQTLTNIGNVIAGEIQKQ